MGPVVSQDGRKLFLIGFATLYLELVLIRYLASSIWNLGYFPNLVLIAVFVGMGLGFVFHHLLPDEVSPLVFQAAFWVLLFLIVMVHWCHPAVPGFGPRGGTIGGELYFTSKHEGLGEPSYLLLAICFLLTAVTFGLIAQRTAKLFRLFKPLTAYSLDIAGSCAGILGFMLTSWLGLDAYLWFGIFTLVFLASMSDSVKTRWIPLVPALVIVLLVRHQDTVSSSAPGYAGKIEVQWSPYQKVEYIDHPGMPRSIFANMVWHQNILTAPQLSQSIYQPPYDDRAKRQGLPPYKTVLILGSGAGNDTAAALMNGAEHVDAVEIDPAIARLGLTHHPAEPYRDPRVNLVVDDGRSFMTGTTRRYDLIVFALTDSLVKVSPVAQLRLENYLFTLESVERAFQLAAEDGDVVFYNFYRTPWLTQKMLDMIAAGTKKLPRVIFRVRDFFVIKASKAGPAAEGPVTDKELFTIPTDDWPFLYLKERKIPSLYLKAMLGMLLFIGLLAFGVHWSTRRRERLGGAGMLPTKIAFVLMGVAFLLLETKSVIQFSLLFGTTWMNNSLVFLAVLLLVLAANWTATLFRRPGVLRLVFLALVLSSLGTLIYPLENLLDVESSLLRFVAAGLLTFSPVFFANLLFSIAFRDQQVAEHLLGWNLIGATIGGVAEYTSMALGYNLLALIVAGCYTLAFLLLVVARRRGAPVY